MISRFLINYGYYPAQTLLENGFIKFLGYPISDFGEKLIPYGVTVKSLLNSDFMFSWSMLLRNFIFSKFKSERSIDRRRRVAAAIYPFPVDHNIAYSDLFSYQDLNFNFDQRPVFEWDFSGPFKPFKDNYPGVYVFYRKHFHFFVSLFFDLVLFSIWLVSGKDFRSYLKKYELDLPVSKLLVNLKDIEWMFRNNSELRRKHLLDLLYEPGLNYRLDWLWYFARERMKLNRLESDDLPYLPYNTDEVAGGRYIDIFFGKELASYDRKSKEYEEKTGEKKKFKAPIESEFWRMFNSDRLGFGVLTDWDPLVDKVGFKDFFTSMLPSFGFVGGVSDLHENNINFNNFLRFYEFNPNFDEVLLGRLPRYELDSLYTFWLPDRDAINHLFNVDMPLYQDRHNWEGRDINKVLEDFTKMSSELKGKTLDEITDESNQVEGSLSRVYYPFFPTYLEPEHVDENQDSHPWRRGSSENLAESLLVYWVRLLRFLELQSRFLGWSNQLDYTIRGFRC